jgi:serine/threonine-protein kinase
VLGTLGYMAPEQLRDATNVGSTADVYSLGCILFEILAGAPVHARGADGAATTLLDAELSPVTRAPDRNIAPELDAACKAALAFDPAKRPTARVFGERIQRYLDGDRDLEHRRILAREHVARAHEAIADPTRRAEATREAGRALALDPASAEAGALVASLMFDAPTVLPPDLAGRLYELDREASAAAARTAAKTMSSFIAILPLLVWSGVASWGWMAAAAGAMAVASGLAYYQGRTGRTNELLALAYMSVLCVFVSRFAGVFLVVPGMMMIAMMGLGQQATLISRPFLLVSGGVLALVVPLGLEWIGVFEPLTTIAPGRIEVSSSILAFEGTPTFVALLVPNLMMVVAAGVFGRQLAVARREAIRSLEIQKWHYSRLIPESAR